MNGILFLKNRRPGWFREADDLQKISYYKLEKDGHTSGFK
jgi:hypothetical protein